MPRNLIFIHSAGPQDGENGSSKLIARLETALADRFHIIAPAMPDPQKPDIDAWLAIIDQTVCGASPGTVLMGHSLGGSSLLQYLARHTDIWRNAHFPAVLSVAAPFWGLTDWEIPEFRLSESEIAVLRSLNGLHFCHSRDDEIVDFTHCETYLSHFPRARQIVLETAGHLMAHGNIDKLIKDILIYS